MKSFGARIATLVSIVGLLAAGCGSENGERGDAGGSPASREAKKGGSLSVASAQSISQLDPHKVVFTFETATWNLVFDSLTQYTKDGGAEVQPGLAESWKAAPNQKTWTFKLRDGVTFSDGRELTSKDVEFSFDRVLDPKTGWFLHNLYAELIDDVVAVDPSTVEFRLKRPSAFMPALMTRIMIVDPGTVAEVNKNAVGTGPYVVKEFVADDRLVLARNEKYWGEPAPLDELRFVHTEDPTAAVTSLRGGDVQVVYETPWTDAPSLEEDPQLNVVAVEEHPPTHMNLLLDNSTPPFDDAKARQALSHALDRQTIVDKLFAGRALAATTNSPLPSDDPYFNKSLPAHDFDLEKAKALFAEAGVSEGDTLTYWSTKAVTEFSRIGEVLQSDLGKIGIKLNIQNVEIAAWGEKFFPRGKKWPGMIVPNYYTSWPSPFILGVMYEKEFCTCNWNDPQFERLIDEAEVEPDEQKRKELYGEAQEAFTKTSPVIVIGQFGIPVATRSDVTGVWHDPGSYVKFQDLALTE